MVGRAPLDPRQVRKQALILESDLNRLALRAEVQNFRSAITGAGDATRTCRTLAPWLLYLAPVAGFLAFVACGTRSLWSAASPRC